MTTALRKKVVRQIVDRERRPDFSANLVNQIVEKYFIRRKEKRSRFPNVKKYLSKVITEAQPNMRRLTSYYKALKLNILFYEQKPFIWRDLNINRSTLARKWCSHKSFCWSVE